MIEKERTGGEDRRKQDEWIEKKTVEDRGKQKE